MAKFAVCLTQDVTQSMVLHVEAENRDDAMVRAMNAYHDGEHMTQGVKFQVDDNAYEGPYVSWADPQEQEVS